MAVFEITYFDVKDNQEHTHEIQYDGPEMSTADTWRMMLESGLKWCEQNRVCFSAITCICM